MVSNYVHRADGRSVVLVVDDDAQVRALLRNALVGEPDLRVVAVGDGEQGLLRAWELAPALILADLMMSGIDGVTFCRLLRGHPATALTPIVAISGADPGGERARALRTHCVAWLSKPFDMDALMATVRSLIVGADAPPRAPVAALSRRQREVALLIARGLTNREIGDALVLEEGTVANHVRRILLKLGLRSRTQVALWSIEQGLHPAGRDPSVASSRRVGEA